nr:LuxR C-terminal-related transcriptional regulator [Rhizobium bangladeshense]
MLIYPAEHENECRHLRILSPFETVCLRWVSQGRTLAEVASIEGISVRQIERFLERALEVLGASSIQEALQKNRFSLSEQRAHFVGNESDDCASAGDSC